MLITSKPSVHRWGLEIIHTFKLLISFSGGDSMKFKKWILKTLVIGLMLCQAPAYADLWTNISSRWAALWQDYKPAIWFSIGAIGIAAFITGYKKYYSAQKALPGRRKSDESPNNEAQQKAKSANDQAYWEKIEHTAKFAANGKLSVENLNGKITITTTDDDTISISAWKKASCQAALRNTQIQISQDCSTIKTVHAQNAEGCAHALSSTGSSNSLIINGHEFSGRSIHCASVDYIISVPRTTSVSTRNTNGSVHIHGCLNADAYSINGAIRLQDCKEKASAQNTNGLIDLQKCNQSAATSVNGSITVAHCTRTQASTTNGDVTVTQTQHITSLKTTNGTITVDGKRVQNGHRTAE